VRLDDELVKAASLASPRGLLVVSVDPNGPGRRAGMLIGDIITAWNGEALRNVRDVFGRLGSETVGRQVNFALVRAGKVTSANLEIAERPMS
jgi:S1-C subfamily serine protease